MMTGGAVIYAGARLFDGHEWHRDHVLVVRDGCVQGILPFGERPSLGDHIDLGGGVLAPGYVDLQVNGGGGVLLNDDPSLSTLRTMTQAHARLGATTILPTLITDSPDRTKAAINAVKQAVDAKVPGLAGLHLEGPHLAPSRKGAHDPGLIRPMEPADLAVLIDAAAHLPCLKVTLAPEVVTLDQIKALCRAGIIVSLGHSDADFETCRRAADAGASCVTHLFNAMSQIRNREPGLVGAALALDGLSAGVIADGIHVHTTNMAMALKAKVGPGRIFLVSDAMATAGSDITAFTLNGRRIKRQDRRLTLEDGTLAGADLDLTTAVRFLVKQLNVPLGKALAMATSGPASLLGRGSSCGGLLPGDDADFILLNDEVELVDVWTGGVRLGDTVQPSSSGSGKSWLA